MNIDKIAQTQSKAANFVDIGLAVIFTGYAH